MSKFSQLFEDVDHLLKKRICNLPSDKDQKRNRIDEEVNGHLVSRDNTDVSDSYFHIFGVIDQKAGGLLTHISVMIAVNVFLLGTPTPPWLDFASKALLVGFLSVAFLVLRLMRFWTSGFPDAIKNEHGNWILADPSRDLLQEMEDSFKEETFYRGKLYRLSLNLTTLLTVLSAILIIVYVQVPEPISDH